MAKGNVTVEWQAWEEDASGRKENLHLHGTAYIEQPVDRSRQRPCPNKASGPHEMNRKDGETRVSIERYSSASGTRCV